MCRSSLLSVQRDKKKAIQSRSAVRVYCPNPEGAHLLEFGGMSSKQKKSQWTSGSSRNFKLLHQSLTISEINFKKQTILVIKIGTVFT